MQNTLIISDTCVLWEGTKDKDGYGIQPFDGKQGRAHRNAYRLGVGNIPEGMLVCHTCDVPSCINTDHLFLGTPKDNMQDKVNKGRQHRPLGSLNGMSLLKESEVEIIKSMLREEKYTHDEISHIFKCSRQLITLINTGKRWSHVE